MLSYRAISFWLPTVPGAVAYFQLRRTVARWREEQSVRPAAATSAQDRGGGARTAGALRAMTYSPVKRRYTLQSETTRREMQIAASDVENVIVIGSGPAGYTAALYTSRANLSPLVIEGFAWGGLLQQTTDVENYPGFPEGIMGPEMMQKLRDQAERFGARLLTEEAERVELASEPGGIHKVWVGDTEYRARTVILAMGAEHKKLEVPGELELSGRGVSYCATCDAAFFRDTPDGDRRRRRLGDGGGDLPVEVRLARSRSCIAATSSARRRSCSIGRARRRTSSC